MVMGDPQLGATDVRVKYKATYYLHDGAGEGAYIALAGSWALRGGGKVNTGFWWGASERLTHVSASKSCEPRSDSHRLSLARWIVKSSRAPRQNDTTPVIIVVASREPGQTQREHEQVLKPHGRIPLPMRRVTPNNYQNVGFGNH